MCYLNMFNFEEGINKIENFYVTPNFDKGDFIFVVIKNKNLCA